MTEIRIALIDDHDLFREGLQLVINRIAGFRVVFDTPDGNRFVEALSRIPVDIALMDIEMPVINGIETTSRALAVKPDLKVIALTMFSDSGHYTRMIHAGAKGFILKEAGKFELEQAIHTVYRGGSFFSQEILKKLVCKYINPEPENESLTSREQEVMLLICRGSTSQEIAEKLHISLKTVETHRSNLFIKSNVKNSAGLVVWAIKNHYFKVE